MKTRLAALALALAGAACTGDNNASIQVQQICAPTEDCTFAATCDMQYIGVVTMDTALTDQLWLFLQVNNHLADDADEQRGKLNTNDAYVEEYEVEYEGLAAPDVSGRLQTLVPAGGSAVVSVFPIPSTVGAMIATTGDVIAKLRLKGKYADESSFETAQIDIPIRICSGCTAVPVCESGAAAGLCPPNPGQLPVAASCGT